uniref:NAD-dependent epimerase/dehydratase domain-containing protein n=1 Tax=Picea sitchensis TaxID=3332 RepID=A9P2C7_PICSI|nr:unknown [Picea sitchensis]
MAAKMNIDPLFTQQENRRQVYCVTGGGGYIGSWLVKTLLENGYTVHATLRDPGNTSKNSFLLSLPGAQERLRLFKADLCEEGSFDSAIHGCHGVFHVATPMEFGSKDPENEIVNAAVQGTLNVLKSCKRAESVRRVVFTSSLSAAIPFDKSLLVIDESCWTSLDVIRKINNHGRFYAEAKTLAEKAALQFGKENPSLAVVSIVLPIVAGTSRTSTAPFSIHMVLSLITGNPQLYGSLLQARDGFLGDSVSLIHVQDVCNAHVFLMEHPTAEGRYICCGNATTIPELAHLISEHYPQYTIKAKLDESVVAAGCARTISAKKLSDLGFIYKYSVAQVIDDSVQFFQKLGILN